MANEVKLIDRDEVGAKIQAMYIRREIDYGGENEFCRGMRKALRIIEDAPTVEVQPDNGWISVKDRLPENDGLYIVCKTIRGHQISFEAHWKGNKWLSVVNNNLLDYVTHWMPLPEPPKGG